MTVDVAGPQNDPGGGRHVVEVEGRRVVFSSLDKVLYPDAGVTKGEVVAYYARIGPVLLPHLHGRPVTFKRAPQGMAGPSFYEKNRPRGAPDWVQEIVVPSNGSRSRGPKTEVVRYPVIDGLPALLWAANLDVLEFHVPMWRVDARGAPRRPDLLVFDLDPGTPATVTDCCEVAAWLREALSADNLAGYPKTSGSKGLQVYARWPSRRRVTTSEYARRLAAELEASHPDRVLSNMKRSLRRGKVLIDWSQNHPAKTTVAAYSTRLTSEVGVSTPVTWAEVEAVAKGGDPGQLRFTMADVFDRVARHGDLFADLAGD